MPAYRNGGVIEYLMQPCHTSVFVSQAVLNEWTETYSGNDNYPWAITLMENGPEPIGGIAGCHQFSD